MSRDLAVDEKSARSADLVRRAAHAALLSFEKTPLAADLLVERFSSKDFDARDRAFLRELIYGVLRWRGRLDFVFGQFLEKPKLAPPAREALRLGTYQLLFMNRVPAHGAVGGAVSLLDRPNLGWAKGLVNAVLRKVAAHEVAPPKKPEDYLTIWESHPRWLVKRWVRTLGDEEAQRRCRANNEEAPVVFRVNTRVSDTRGLAAELASEGVATRAGCVDPDCLGFLPDESAAGLRFSDTAAWREGKFIVVDESSSLVSRFAGAAEGERILDACAFGMRSLPQMSSLIAAPALSCPLKRILSVSEYVAGFPTSWSSMPQASVGEAERFLMRSMASTCVHTSPSG